jgi:hypothetical protein
MVLALLMEIVPVLMAGLVSVAMVRPSNMPPRIYFPYA